MVLRVYIDGANIGRTRALQRERRPDVSPRILWTAVQDAYAYFAGNTPGECVEPQASFVRKHGGTKISVAIRLVFNESTLGFLQRSMCDDKYWQELNARESFFLTTPNRESDDCWMLAEATKAYKRGDTVAVISKDNFDDFRDCYREVVGHCVMKYMYDHERDVLSLKESEVESRIEREARKQREQMELRGERKKARQPQQAGHRSPSSCTRLMTDVIEISSDSSSASSRRSDSRSSSSHSSSLDACPHSEPHGYGWNESRAVGELADRTRALHLHGGEADADLRREFLRKELELRKQKFRQEASDLVCNGQTSSAT